VWRRRDVGLLPCRTSGIARYRENPGEVGTEDYLIVRGGRKIKPGIVLIGLITSGLSDDDFLNIGYSVKASATKVSERQILAQRTAERSEVQTAADNLTGNPTIYVSTRGRDDPAETWLDTGATEDRGSDSARACVDDGLPELRRFNITGRERSCILSQPFVREKEKISILAALNRWATLTESGQIEWATKAASELTEEAFYSFDAAAPKVVWILIKSVKLWTVVFKKGTSMKLISPVLRYDFDLRARVSTVLSGIGCR
jgi:hypothetical protein